MSCINELFKLLNVSKDCYSDKSSCHESGKSFSISSSTKRFCTIKIDGCLIKSDKVRKCDYLIVECGNTFKFHFVELKGEAISDACEQIFKTIEFIKRNLRNTGVVLNDQNMFVHIVCKLGTKANQRKEEIAEDFREKYLISPKFYTQDSARIKV